MAFHIQVYNSNSRHRLDDKSRINVFSCIMFAQIGTWAAPHWHILALWYHGRLGAISLILSSLISWQMPSYRPIETLVDNFTFADPFVQRIAGLAEYAETVTTVECSHVGAGVRLGSSLGRACVQTGAFR